ncbi:MAG: hypothetical protein ACK55Z_10370 [bacterium]
MCRWPIRRLLRPNRDRFFSGCRCALAATCCMSRRRSITCAWY